MPWTGYEVYFWEWVGVILVLVSSNREAALGIFELWLRKSKTDISLVEDVERRLDKRRGLSMRMKWEEENGIRKRREWIYIFSSMCLYLIPSNLEESFYFCLQRVFQYRMSITQVINTSIVWFWNPGLILLWPWEPSKMCKIIGGE